ncbi:hypothetical protein AVEN_133547-1 [Araneus ventricosus]|uniref:Uncharacterized protein n=1 Tax=Araneus ventricosus TaxID=182803 RepID=A0A4Y2QKW6_ARAVE|nr:hypothetical protein AVEN_41941-1 [Araneus ventricosus]GBN63983.1 hypothetical protein AVEN_133547-1 [Araneus ventricosus]
MNVGVLRGPILTSAGPYLSGKRYCEHMNPYLRFLMKILAERLLGRRMKQTIHPVTRRVVLKASSVMVWGCLEANGVDNLHFCTAIYNSYKIICDRNGKKFPQTH